MKQTTQTKTITQQRPCKIATQLRTGHERCTQLK